MSITYAAALAQLREQLNEEAASTWTDPELLRYLYHGTRRIAQRVLGSRDSTTVAVTLGTQTYTAPTDMILASRMVFGPTGDTSRIPLELRAKNEMDELWGAGQVQSTGDPRYACMWGNSPSVVITLYPTPSRSGTLYIDYYSYPALPATFTTTALGSTTMDVPNGYEDLAITYAEMRARRRVGDDQWQVMAAEFEAELATMDSIVSLPHHDNPGKFVLGGAALYGGINPWWMNQPY